MIFRHPLRLSPLLQRLRRVLEPGHAFHRLDEPRSPGVDTDYFLPCGVNVALDHVACENTTLRVCARRVQAF